MIVATCKDHPIQFVLILFGVLGIPWGGVWAQMGELNHAFGNHGSAMYLVNGWGDSARWIAVYPASSTHAGKVVVA